MIINRHYITLQIQTPIGSPNAIGFSIRQDRPESVDLEESVR